MTTRRSLQWVMDHADELATRFENWEPPQTTADHECDGGIFSRTVCACGWMHSYCSVCGWRVEDCCD